jgi:hypothetical protein
VVYYVVSELLCIGTYVRYAAFPSTLIHLLLTFLAASEQRQSQRLAHDQMLLLVLLLLVCLLVFAHAALTPMLCNCAVSVHCCYYCHDRLQQFFDAMPHIADDTFGATAKLSDMLC